MLFLFIINSYKYKFDYQLHFYVKSIQMGKMSNTFTYLKKRH